MGQGRGPPARKRLIPHSMTGLVFLFSALKLYVSSDLGKKWTLLRERVTKDHVFW